MFLWRVFSESAKNFRLSKCLLISLYLSWSKFDADDGDRDHLKETSTTAEDSRYPIEYAKTQRGRDMLIYAGYRYVENRQSNKNKFWRCSRYVKFGCRATIVTSKHPAEFSVRLSGLAHSHGPEKKQGDARLIRAGPHREIRNEPTSEDAVLVAAATDAADESDSDSDDIDYDLMQKSLFQQDEFYGVDL